MVSHRARGKCGVLANKASVTVLGKSVQLCFKQKSMAARLGANLHFYLTFSTIFNVRGLHCKMCYKTSSIRTTKEHVNKYSQIRYKNSNVHPSSSLVHSTVVTTSTMQHIHPPMACDEYETILRQKSRRYMAPVCLLRLYMYRV